MKKGITNAWLYAITTTIVICENFSSNEYSWHCLALKHPAGSSSPVTSALHSTLASDSGVHKHVDPLMLKELTSFANDLADAASNAIMPYWRQKGVEIESKIESGRSLSQTILPVTIADRSAEKAMRELIEERFPSHGIYGEEFGQVRVDADFVWVLDPIDGTKAFITGKPTWGILIACLFRGVPIVGVIDQCILKERWVGSAGNPTLLNGEPVSVASTSATKLCDSTIYTTTPDMFRAGEEWNKFQVVRDKSLRTLYGCDCYAYALVASGFGADAVVEADLGLYDYAAIVPVMEGAGGVITDWNGNALTLQNHDNCLGRVVACSNSDLHSEMLLNLSGTKPEPTDEQRIIRTKYSKKSIFRYTIALICGIALGVIGKPGQFI